MKTFFEDPILRIVLFDVCDLLTVSEPENPDDGDDSDTPIIGNNP